MTLASLKSVRIAGNAHSDFDLINSIYDISLRALSDNDIVTAFDAYDYLGVEVMGTPDMDWDEFVECLTLWHRDIRA